MTATFTTEVYSKRQKKVKIEKKQQKHVNQKLPNETKIWKENQLSELKGWMRRDFKNYKTEFFFFFIIYSSWRKAKKIFFCYFASNKRNNNFFNKICGVKFKEKPKPKSKKKIVFSNCSTFNKILICALIFWFFKSESRHTANSTNFFCGQ